MFEDVEPPPAPPVTVVPKKHRQRSAAFVPDLDSVFEPRSGEPVEAEGSVDQPTAHPTAKVGIGVGLGGGTLVGLQMWAKQRFGVELLDIEIALLTWLGSLAAAYFTREKK
jgi:hypothetical protein